MVHGRNSYKRSAALSQFVIHRSLCISAMQVEAKRGAGGSVFVRPTDALPPNYRFSPVGFAEKQQQFAKL